jgi:glycosyltransferase involved in cell wall biosynthesis
MDSEANHDGAMFFLREVWPLLRRPGRPLVVKMVGRAPQAELLAAHDGRECIVTGKVDEVLPYYREALAAIVPLRSGGGTRLKIVEALAAGTPVVSTSVGCEGLDVVDGRTILIADSPQAFAAAIERLLEDPALAAALSRDGRRLVEERYDWPLIAAVHAQVYEAADAGRVAA